jgi:hypothetical protein
MAGAPQSWDRIVAGFDTKKPEAAPSAPASWDEIVGELKPAESPVAPAVDLTRTGGVGMSAARPVSFGESVQRIFTEGALGKLFAAKPSAEAQRLAPFDKTAVPIAAQPTLKLSELAGQGTPQTITEGVHRGVLEGLEGFTSPQGVAMIASLGKLGKLRGVGKALTAAIGAGFDADMIGHAVKEVPEAKQLWDAGRQPEAAQVAVRSLLTGALGLSGAVQKGRELSSQSSLPRGTSEAAPPPAAAPLVESPAPAKAAPPAAPPKTWDEAVERVQTPAKETGSAFDDVPQPLKVAPKRTAAEEHLVDQIGEKEDAAHALAERAKTAPTDAERADLLRQAEEVAAQGRELEDLQEQMARSAVPVEEPTEAPPAAKAEETGSDVYQRAVAHVRNLGKASTSTLQREFRMGYGAATKLLERMEQDGIVGPADGSRPREVFQDSPSPETAVVAPEAPPSQPAAAPVVAGPPGEERGNAGRGGSGRCRPPRSAWTRRVSSSRRTWGSGAFRTS